MAILLVVANNDLDLLAPAGGGGGLPDGFPPVRAFGGVGLDARTPAPALDGVAGRARPAAQGPGGLGGALRPSCARVRAPSGASPLLAFGGEASSTPSWPRLSTVPAGIVTEASAYWSAGGPANLAHLLRFVADTVLLEGFGFEPPADVPSVGVLGDAARRPRPPHGRRRHLPGQRAGRRHPAGRAAVRRHRGPGRQRPGRAAATRCAPRPTAARPRRSPCSRDADVVVTTTWAAGGAVHAGDARGRRHAARAGRRRWTPSACRSSRRSCPPAPTDAWARPARRPVAPRRRPWAWPSPSSTGASSGRRSPSRRWSTTATSSASPLRPPRRPRPGRAGRRPGHPPRPPPAHPAGRQAGGGRAVRLPDQAQPHRQRGRRSTRPPACSRLLDALRDRRLRRRRPVAATDGDALMARLADGLTYDAAGADAGPAGAGGRRLPVDDYDALVRHPARRRCGSRVEAAWGPAPGEVCVHDGHLVFAGLDLGDVVVAIQPPAGLRRRPDRHLPRPRPAAAPPLPRLLPLAGRGLGRRRRRAPRQARHARVAAGQGRRAVGGVRPRRCARRPAAALPVRRQRPRRGHPGQAPRPRRRSSTTCLRR